MGREVSNQKEFKKTVPNLLSLRGIKAKVKGLDGVETDKMVLKPFHYQEVITDDFVRVSIPSAKATSGFADRYLSKETVKTKLGESCINTDGSFNKAEIEKNLKTFEPLKMYHSVTIESYKTPRKTDWIHDIGETWVREWKGQNYADRFYGYATSIFIKKSEFLVNGKTFVTKKLAMRFIDEKGVSYQFEQDLLDQKLKLNSSLKGFVAALASIKKFGMLQLHPSAKTEYSLSKGEEKLFYKDFAKEFPANSLFVDGVFQDKAVLEKYKGWKVETFTNFVIDIKNCVNFKDMEVKDLKKAFFGDKEYEKSLKVGWGELTPKYFDDVQLTDEDKKKYTGLEKQLMRENNLKVEKFEKFVETLNEKIKESYTNYWIVDEKTGKKIENFGVKSEKGGYVAEDSEDEVVAVKSDEDVVSAEVEVEADDQDLPF